ncbi:uncharacterized protein RCC_02273 [Ramularia collo-cygni]|uniref:Uncharacterized protein n=1 Tax=Ramularia collo-cygni TaxID=112498 RepID=A0A2D3UU54_9PEZI|nr:uncharacterized protein RCC_02273 [Ramularia collo-cygni]CZT16430.1 uncharacterized protein RCC_02273 [Ramularia collo-cygni]
MPQDRDPRTISQGHLIRPQSASPSLQSTSASSFMGHEPHDSARGGVHFPTRLPIASWRNRGSSDHVRPASSASLVRVKSWSASQSSNSQGQDAVIKQPRIGFSSAGDFCRVSDVTTDADASARRGGRTDVDASSQRAKLRSAAFFTRPPRAISGPIKASAPRRTPIDQPHHCSPLSSLQKAWSYSPADLPTSSDHSIFVATKGRSLRYHGSEPSTPIHPVEQLTHNPTPSYQQAGTSDQHSFYDDPRYERLESNYRYLELQYIEAEANVERERTMTSAKEVLVENLQKQLQYELQLRRHAEDEILHMDRTEQLERVIRRVETNVTKMFSEQNREITRQTAFMLPIYQEIGRLKHEMNRQSSRIGEIEQHIARHAVAVEALSDHQVDTAQQIHELHGLIDQPFRDSCQILQTAALTLETFVENETQDRSILQRGRRCCCEEVVSLCGEISRAQDAQISQQQQQNAGLSAIQNQQALRYTLLTAKVESLERRHAVVANQLAS